MPLIYFIYVITAVAFIWFVYALISWGKADYDEHMHHSYPGKPRKGNPHFKELAWSFWVFGIGMVIIVVYNVHQYIEANG